MKLFPGAATLRDASPVVSHTSLPCHTSSGSVTLCLPFHTSSVTLSLNVCRLTAPSAIMSAALLLRSGGLALIGTAGRRGFASSASHLLHRTDREQLNYDVLIVGAGPAGLCAAIRIKQVRPDVPAAPVSPAWWFMLGACHLPTMLGACSPHLAPYSDSNPLACSPPLPTVR